MLKVLQQGTKFSVSPRLHERVSTAPQLSRAESHHTSVGVAQPDVFEPD